MPTAQIATWLPIITALMGGGLVAAVAGLAKVVFGHKRQKREQTDNVALTLVDKLNLRIDALEGEVAREREQCAGRIAKLEQLADEDRRTSDVLDMLRRHQVANSKSVMHMAVDLIEVAPDRIEQIIPRIRKRLEEHEAIEARDKAAYMATRFGGTPPVIEDVAA